MLECDKEETSAEVLSFSSCELVIRVRTAAACSQQQSSLTCVLSDHNGKEYDLSSLHLTSSNWQAVAPQKESGAAEEYYLNVCGPLNLPQAGCPAGSGVCQVVDGR